MKLSFHLLANRFLKGTLSSTTVGLLAVAVVVDVPSSSSTSTSAFNIVESRFSKAVADDKLIADMTMALALAVC